MCSSLKNDFLSVSNYLATRESISIYDPKNRDSS